MMGGSNNNFGLSLLGWQTKWPLYYTLGHLIQPLILTCLLSCLNIVKSYKLVLVFTLPKMQNLGPEF
jgi:hypothetical protein